MVNVSKRSAPGVTVQLKRIFKILDGRGISKHIEKKKYAANMKERGETANPLKSDLIHSLKYYENVLHTSNQFLRWAKENGYGAKFIENYNYTEAGRKYFEERIEKGIKDLNTEAGHLRKLEDAIEKRLSKKISIVPEDFNKMLKEAGYATTKDQKLKQRVGVKLYSKEELKTLIETVSTQKIHGDTKSNAFELQSKLGLRIKEIVCLKVGNIDFDLGKVHIWFGAKGGRKRWVPIPEEYKEKLRTLVNGKEANENVIELGKSKIKSKIRMLQKSWEKACKKNMIEEHKTHNLRVFYANNRIDELIEKEGYEKEEALLILTQEMGHGRTEVLRHYLFMKN